MMHEHIVIGGGEVGSALSRILMCKVHDPQKKLIIQGDTAKVIHIAFPYFDGFAKQVEIYQEYFKSDLTIIHSTVPIGTTQEIKDAVHSPIRGIHPNLEQGIKTFVKYFGGKRASEAEKIFKAKGIKTLSKEDSKETEAFKLLDTMQYGHQIILEKKIHAWCEERGVDFEFVYREGNKTYNEGYQKLGKAEVVRPYLKHVPGKIGGHCVIQNAGITPGELATELLEENKKYENS